MRAKRRHHADTLRVRPHWRTCHRSRARVAVVCFFVSLAWVVAAAGGYRESPWVISLTLVPVLLLSRAALSTLRPIAGRVNARRSKVYWEPRRERATTCSAWLRLPGVVGFRDPTGRRHWIFRDEMSADHWRRLCLIARFSSQNRVSGSGQA